MTEIKSGYDVPQSMRYEEKVLGALTFRQVIYLLLGGIGAVFFWKLPLVETVKIALSALSIISGLILGFAKVKSRNADEHLYSVANYHRRPKRFGYLDAEMAKLIGVKKIQNGSVLMDSGEVLAILKATPINFTMRSDEDKTAIIGLYRRFLDSLTFPIQILVRTVRLDIGSYLKSVKERAKKKSRGKEAGKLFEKFCIYFEKTIEERNVKNRLFYVIVPSGKASKNDVQSTIDSRVGMCIEGLSSCGVRARRLNSGELASLLASFLEGHIEQDWGYLSPITVLGNFEKEGEGKC
uniref:TraC-like domain-containing protein n=1 Tax=uncultured marine group II/III euryarchaeote KM3_51_D01 TaxID=1456454 RepID=A0A075H4L1_9EURY|nr:hypothetical protein [uncultured marine group II/III euryarchaeote KM3_51_D01]